MLFVFIIHFLDYFTFYIVISLIFHCLKVVLCHKGHFDDSHWTHQIVSVFAGSYCLHLVFAYGRRTTWYSCRIISRQIESEHAYGYGTTRVRVRTGVVNVLGAAEPLRAHRMFVTAQTSQNPYGIWHTPPTIPHGLRSCSRTGHKLLMQTLNFSLRAHAATKNPKKNPQKTQNKTKNKQTVSWEWVPVPCGPARIIVQNSLKTTGTVSSGSVMCSLGLTLTQHTADDYPVDVPIVQRINEKSCTLW